MIRHLVLALEWTVFLTVPARTQRPAGANAPAVAVLIGVADRVDAIEHRPRQNLVTYLVTASPTAAQIAARANGLILPRSSGWWQVVVTRSCDRKPESQQSCADSISALPLTGPHASVRPDTGRLAGAGDPCNFDYKALTFVSPTILGASQHTGHSEKCDPRGWAWQDSHWIQRYDNDTLVAYTNWGDVADSAFTRAWRSAINVGSETRPAPPQNDQCQADVDSIGSWGIVREQGRWVPHVFQQQITAQCQLEGPVNWRLPDSLVGFADPVVNWANVTSAVPGAEYAFASPRSDFLLVAVPESFRLYAMTAGKPGATLLQLPRKKGLGEERDQIIMLQWAGGSHAADWARAVGGK